jgi:hypothetical protein
MFLREVKRANKNGTQVSYLQVITYTGSAGTFQQRTEFTAAQRDIYTTLELGPPKKIIELAAPSG